MGKIPFTFAVIYGDYDLHPAEGVEIPRYHVNKNFTFYHVETCGHYPFQGWSARNRFYEILNYDVDQEKG